MPAKATAPTPIPVGAPAPAFTLRDAQGAKRSLSEFRGHPLVIYFYPEDDTPLCTTQACQFRDSHADFAAAGCAVIGVSPDDTASHAAFVSKFKLPFTLLADELDKHGNPKVCTLYGVWGEKNMYGNIVRGMLRTTYLLDATGRVARRWDRVKTPGHAARVLEAVHALVEPLTKTPKRSRTSRHAADPSG